MEYLTAYFSLTYAIIKCMNKYLNIWEISKTKGSTVSLYKNYYVSIVFISDEFAYKLMCLWNQTGMQTKYRWSRFLALMSITKQHWVQHTSDRPTHSPGEFHASLLWWLNILRKEMVPKDKWWNLKDMVLG